MTRDVAVTAFWKVQWCQGWQCEQITWTESQAFLIPRRPCPDACGSSRQLVPGACELSQLSPPVPREESASPFPLRELMPFLTDEPAPEGPPAPSASSPWPEQLAGSWRYLTSFLPFKPEPPPQSSSFCFSCTPK